MIIISSCLIGCPVRYNGSSSKIEPLRKLVDQGMAIALCPEILAGLSIPREPVEIETGKTAEDVLCGKAKVLDKNGKDYAQEFIKGAYKFLEACKENNIKIAVLKSKSPSCGFSEIYDGTFSGTKTKGNGIVSELLIKNGITVYNENNFPLNLKLLI